MIEKLANKILLQGRGDWVSLEEVDMAGRFLAREVDRRAELEADAVMSLVDRGLAELGRVGNDGWHDLTEARTEWRSLVRDVALDIENHGYDIWVNLTPEGEAQAAVTPDDFREGLPHLADD